MPALNSLIQKPVSASPPDVQGTSGTDQAASPQALMQGGQQPQTGMQPPSHQETVALLQHLSAFRRGWQSILDDPEIGEKNVRPQIYEFMADMMGDEYATLPEVMGLLKTLPQTPLEQKQWIEKHVAQDDKAMLAVMQHYASTRPPPGSYEEEQAKAGQVTDDNRAELVRGAVGRYKKNPKRPNNVKGIPIA